MTKEQSWGLRGQKVVTVNWAVKLGAYCMGEKGPVHMITKENINQYQYFCDTQLTCLFYSFLLQPFKGKGWKMSLGTNLKHCNLSKLTDKSLGLLISQPWVCWKPYRCSRSNVDCIGVGAVSGVCSRTITSLIAIASPLYIRTCPLPQFKTSDQWQVQW